jgi:hypothetical protein
MRYRNIWRRKRKQYIISIASSSVTAKNIGMAA